MTSGSVDRTEDEAPREGTGVSRKKETRTSGPSGPYPTPPEGQLEFATRGVVLPQGWDVITRSLGPTWVVVTDLGSQSLTGTQFDPCGRPCPLRSPRTGGPKGSESRKVKGVCHRTAYTGT